MKKVLFGLVALSATVTQAHATEKKIVLLPIVESIPDQHFRLETLGQPPKEEVAIALAVEKRDINGKGFRVSLSPSPKRIVTIRVTF